MTENDRMSRSLARRLLADGESFIDAVPQPRNFCAQVGEFVAQCGDELRLHVHLLAQFFGPQSLNAAHESSDQWGQGASRAS
jgi:hypothetical protein